MKRKRVFELAKELNLTSKQLLEIAHAADIEIKCKSSQMGTYRMDALKAAVQRQQALSAEQFQTRHSTEETISDT